MSTRAFIAVQEEPEVFRYIRCGRCSRPLTNPDSRRLGYGPDCAEVVFGHDGAQPDLFSRQEIPPRSWDRGALVLPEHRQRAYSGHILKAGPVVLVDYPCGRHLLLPHISYHSPTGMAWGYMGSGASDLARSILFDYAGQAIADSFYMAFKADFVAGFDDHWSLSSAHVRSWLTKKLNANCEEL